jgi:tetratricopeptide (TPR) repeat protein
LKIGVYFKDCSTQDVRHEINISREELAVISSDDLGDIDIFIENFAGFDVSSNNSELLYFKKKIEKVRSHLEELVWSKLGDDYKNERNTTYDLDVVSEDLSAFEFPWELLETGYHSVRRVTRTVAISQDQNLKQEPMPLRLLLVVSRPYREDDVPYHLVAEAAYETFSQFDRNESRLHVLVAASFSEVCDVLASAHALGEAYTLVHFDGHGVHEKRTKGVLLGEDIRTQSGLIFEGVEGTPELIAANQIVRVLLQYDCQLAVFSACRSGRTLAPKLVSMGLPQAVSMTHNVLATATPRFFSVFYQNLLQGTNASIASSIARKKLADEAEFSNQWFILVTYGNLYSDGVSFLPQQKARQGTTKSIGCPTNSVEVCFAIDRAISQGPKLAIIQTLLGQGVDEIASDFMNWKNSTSFKGEKWQGLIFCEGEDASSFLAGAEIDGKSNLVIDATSASVAEGLALEEALANYGDESTKSLMFTSSIRPAAASSAIQIVLPEAPKEEGFWRLLMAADKLGHGMNIELLLMLEICGNDQELLNRFIEGPLDGDMFLETRMAFCSELSHCPKIEKAISADLQQTHRRLHEAKSDITKIIDAARYHGSIISARSAHVILGMQEAQNGELNPETFGELQLGLEELARVGLAQPVTGELFRVHPTLRLISKADTIPYPVLEKGWVIFSSLINGMSENISHAVAQEYYRSFAPLFALFTANALEGRRFESAQVLSFAFTPQYGLSDGDYFFPPLKEQLMRHVPDALKSLQPNELSSLYVLCRRLGIDGELGELSEDETGLLSGAIFGDASPRYKGEFLKSLEHLVLSGNAVLAISNLRERLEQVAKQDRSEEAQEFLLSAEGAFAECGPAIKSEYKEILSSVLFNCSDYEGADSESADAIVLARSINRRDLEVRPLVIRSWISYFRLARDEAEMYLAEARQIADETNYRVEDVLDDIQYLQAKIELVTDRIEIACSRFSGLISKGSEAAAALGFDGCLDVLRATASDSTVVDEAWFRKLLQLVDGAEVSDFVSLSYAISRKLKQAAASEKSFKKEARSHFVLGNILRIRNLPEEAYSELRAAFEIDKENGFFSGMLSCCVSVCELAADVDKPDLGLMWYRIGNSIIEILEDHGSSEHCIIEYHGAEFHSAVGLLDESLEINMTALWASQFLEDSRQRALINLEIYSRVYAISLDLGVDRIKEAWVNQFGSIKPIPSMLEGYLGNEMPE